MPSQHPDCVMGLDRAINAVNRCSYHQSPRVVGRGGSRGTHERHGARELSCNERWEREKKNITRRERGREEPLGLVSPCLRVGEAKPSLGAREKRSHNKGRGGFFSSNPWIAGAATVPAVATQTSWRLGAAEVVVDAGPSFNNVAILTRNEFATCTRVFG